MMSANRRTALAVPGFRRLSRLIERFNTRYCRGVFRTFRDAQAAVPAGRDVGYDNEKSSQMYLGCLDYVKPSDYAAFHWLGLLLGNVRALFDFGGNVGWSYYAYQKYLRYPPELRWLVCDVPKVVETGRALAEKRGAPHLSFTTDFRLADGADVLLSNGTLQYVDRELPDLLGDLESKPRHLLLNRVALSDLPTYYTVQDIGPACCPYRISNEAAFVAAIQSLGYSRIDSWRCCESSCRILFHPARTLRHYTGMYFRFVQPGKGAALAEAASCNGEHSARSRNQCDDGVVTP